MLEKFEWTEDIFSYFPNNWSIKTTSTTIWLFLTSTYFYYLTFSLYTFLLLLLLSNIYLKHSSVCTWRVKQFFYSPQFSITILSYQNMVIRKKKGQCYDKKRTFSLFQSSISYRGLKINIIMFLVHADTTSNSNGLGMYISIKENYTRPFFWPFLRLQKNSLLLCC